MVDFGGRDQELALTGVSQRLLYSPWPPLIDGLIRGVRRGGHGATMLKVRADTNMKPAVRTSLTSVNVTGSQVEKAVVSLVIAFPSRSMVSGFGVDTIGESSVLRNA